MIDGWQQLNGGGWDYTGRGVWASITLCSDGFHTRAEMGSRHGRQDRIFKTVDEAKEWVELLLVDRALVL